MHNVASQIRPEATPSAERFDRGLKASLGLHAILAALLLTAPSIFPSWFDEPWGSELGGSGGITLDLAGSSFAIPLPAPARTSPDAVGNDSLGFYDPPAETALPPPAETEAEADAELIPETFEPVEAEEPEPAPESEPEPVRPAPTPPAPPAPPAPTPAAAEPPRNPAPSNAIPFGEGGQPSLNSGLSQGGAGFDGGGGAFGQEHGAYVTAITQRISREWIQGTIDAILRTAPRAYIGFDIQRNGAITNVRVLESSGHRDVDDSAERAVYAANPLGPLPATYRGSSVSVRFWFELRR